MKILLTILLLSVLGVQAVRPPSAVCKTTPLISQIPITVGEELRFDLEDVFRGYNLFFQAENKSHITLAEKYTVMNTQFPTSYNFRTVKLKPDGRFIGLVTNEAYSNLIIGKSNDTTGITIEYQVELQSSDMVHCYDVDEILTHSGAFVVADCASFIMGEVLFNEFIFVNMTDRKVIEGRHLHDTFVRYNHISKRRIEVIQDPFSRIPYLFRVHLRDGVSAEHQDQTYLQIFSMNNPLDPQLIDVLDYTFFDLNSLSIADFQVHMNLVYILVYNKGIYELRLTPDQHVQIRSKFEMKMDMNRFRVDQLGFNDDLNIVMTNGHTVYQFQWDVTTPPVLTHKYTLAPNSQVEQIFVDYNYVIVVADVVFGEELVRRTWVFTKFSNDYLNAYNVFHAPLGSPHIIVWNQHGSTLHIFHNYNAFFIKMNLPYIDVKPVDSSLAGQTQNFSVKATSFGDNEDDKVECIQTFQFIYLEHLDKRILKTGLWPRNQIFVDSPDERQIPLGFQFLGPNLSYNVTFETSGNPPYYYIDKQRAADIKWPQDIDPTKIVFFQMFSEIRTEQQKPTAVYGLVQTSSPSNTSNTTVYTTFYIECKINVFSRDQVYHLDCKTILNTRFSMGRILQTSQMFDPEMRRIAITFESAPSTVYIYYFWPEGFGYFGRKYYGNDAGNRVTGIALDQSKLFVVFEFGKRVDIFHLDDLHDPTDAPNNAQPRMVLNSQVMHFFGIDYFAPVTIKISKFHKEAIFLQTKTGVMALNVNEDCIPQLLFTVTTQNIRYDFQINHQSLLILTELTGTLYSLQLPLRRSAPPLKRQNIDYKFKIHEYDQLCSDRLFYLVGPQTVAVVNPDYFSTSALFSEIQLNEEIINVDSVNIQDKEIFFMRTSTRIAAVVFTEDPKLYINWQPPTTDFNMSLSAYNPANKSDAYSLHFNVLDFNETIISPTPDFNETEIFNLGHLKSPAHNVTYSGTIQLNDSNWFEGTVLSYSFQCQNCTNYTTFRNHMEVTNDKLVEGRAIYDIESTINGIYAQQYSSLFKSYTHNDSIHFINKIPTTRMGEVCTKLAAGPFEKYIISLCELGTHVNAYITSLVATKPFTFGPYATDAKAVNKAKIEGNILMIVDNDDDPMARSGGVYLYHINYDIDDPDFISLLDYIDYEDLQIQGFQGTPHIGSADIHRPFYDANHEYRIFLTESRTGAIFVFGFEVSADGEEVIYLSKKYIPLQKLIPTQLKYPTPLRILTVNIHYAFEVNKTVEYYLLLTVKNWHHMQLMMTLTPNDQIVTYKLERLFERFPWELQNYFKFKQGRQYDTIFAVPYIDFDQQQQIILTYSVPYMINRYADNYDEKYSQHLYDLEMGVPLLRAFGSHPVSDTYETAYAFHTFGTDKLLWTDMDGYDISQITLFKNISLEIKNMPVPNDTIVITAVNPYSNYSFNIDISFTKVPDDDDDKNKNYLWIGIVAVGVVMIIGLIIVYCRQKAAQDKMHHHHRRELAETLLTEDNINRSSADPASVRGSVEPGAVRAVQPQNQEEGSSSGDQVQELTH